MVASQLPRGKQRREHITPDGFLQLGRHAGKHISEVPESWLRWALDQHWIDPEFREAIKQRLNLDKSEDDTEPDPTSAAVAFPLIVWQVEQHVWNRYFANDELLAVGSDIIDLLKRLCSKYTKRPWLKIDAVRKAGVA